MPGLFSWKSRIWGRKTPDPERAQIVHDTPRETKRMVRFDDDGVGRSRELTKSPTEWQYADELKVAVAPLAREEVDESREERQASVPRTNSGRASAVLQHLRDDDRVLSDGDEPSALRRTNRTLGSLGVVYLELNDEVKRALLPPTVQSIDTVRALFLRSFPHLTAQYLSLPHVKIYIQDPSKGTLFYELDDLSDIKDRAVLKLREHVSGLHSPQPVRFTDHPPLDYLSESDVDVMEFRGRAPHRTGIRPASALDTRPYSAAKSARSPIPNRYDAFYDPYASDTSSQDARSGSVTPIIDKEARFRMETMERQLAGLSSLVHSALVSKGMSDTSQRDMQELRRQILALHPDVHSESSMPSSTEPSLPDSISLNGEAQQQLQKLKRQVADAQAQLKHIRRAAQVNAQTTRDVLREAFERIQKHLSEHLNTAGPPLPNSTNPANDIDMLKSEHVAHVTALHKSLQTFEEDVEEVRMLVLNTNRKLRMAEVEQFTNALTKIGRNAAKLKTQFPALQQEVQNKIKGDMERVVREEKFLKEESGQIDQCLRRCKTLANMMVTMKKLAMVQDPAVSSTYKGEKISDDTVKNINGNNVLRSHTLDNAALRPTGTSVIVSAPPLSVDSHPGNGDVPPPVPPAPTNYEGPSTSSNGNSATVVGPKKEDAHVLDTILDELTSNTPPHLHNDLLAHNKPLNNTNNNNVIGASTNNTPPKPPERRSTRDVRSRFLASEVHELQRRALDCVSPLQGTSMMQQQQQQQQSQGLPMPPSTYPNSQIRPIGFQNPPQAITTTDALAMTVNDVRSANGASSSESVNSQEGDHRSSSIEARQQKLVQKQRQLHSQFEQLQQMCPTPNVH